MGQLLGAILEDVFEYAIEKFIGGWGRTIVAGFRESVLQGLVCLFIPPYTIYYAIELGRQRSEVKSVITEFMEAVVARNVESAYAYCSLHSPTREEIAGVIESSYKIFEGYERLTISSQNPKSSGGITTCYVSGEVIYSSAPGCPFEAWLAKDNGVWKITGINIGSTAGSTAKKWSNKKTLIAIGVGVLGVALMIIGFVAGLGISIFVGFFVLFSVLAWVVYSMMKK